PQASQFIPRRERTRSGVTTAEELYVGLRGTAVRPDQIQQRLAGMAAAHGMTATGEVADPGTRRMVLRWHGIVTHRIEIEQLPGIAGQTSLAPGPARLAILLDDLDNDRSTAESILALQ